MCVCLPERMEIKWRENLKFFILTHTYALNCYYFWAIERLQITRAINMWIFQENPCHSFFSLFFISFLCSYKKPLVLALGDCIPVRPWSDSPIACIAELRMVWRDKNEQCLLASLRLYFLPENTPIGRNCHGEVSVASRFALHTLFPFFFPSSSFLMLVNCVVDDVEIYWHVGHIRGHQGNFWFVFGIQFKTFLALDHLIF